MINLDKWVLQYEKELIWARRNHPDKFIWPDSKLPEVVSKMREAFTKGTYNKDSYAIRGACKHFDIPCTYTAINRFLKGESQ